MTMCPSCKRSVAVSALKCPGCGLALDETSGATAFLPSEQESQSVHSTASADGAKFSAGTILADRYRIVSLLGRGGMGEVYKAEDLTLKQIVALKFLPEALARDGASLARFQNEVRITRQISHPNVCRVYDIGETQGLHFLSMEFIDGEDLSLLLRRIGRLPGDKANEIARQICAGLAAAHDNGVLHRDLKPANIMIDGRGKARVTDFGVAVVARELLGAEATSGTPAYMAPEQLKGKEVTQKSDIYSLGLVLYELFTGKRVYDSDNLPELMKLHESSSPTSPSSHVEHLDPLVERVIMRCLEKEPNKRPATAFQVAAALPGGDPLAAALAAGETPSPEMVAASGEKTGLRPAVAVAIFAAIVTLIVVTAILGNNVDWRAQVLRENSPEVLTHQARNITQQLGYTGQPADTASGMSYVNDYRSYLLHNENFPDGWSQFTKSQPAPIIFWYRQSPRYLGVEGWDGPISVSRNDPPQNVTDMVRVELDPKGRLTYMSAVPPQVDKAVGDAATADWSVLFSAAGLDASRFVPTDPKWLPLAGFDSRAAWTGTYPDQPDIPLRIEAAAWRGQPVYFQLIAPWTRPERDQDLQGSTGKTIKQAILISLVMILLTGAVLLARSNLKRGRGDRRGAFRIALFVFALGMLEWLFGASHMPNSSEVGMFFSLGVGQSLMTASFLWLVYIALEPHARRHWPVTMISWSRLIGGGVRDVLVGRDILIGVLFGSFLCLMVTLGNAVRYLLKVVPESADSLDIWVGARYLVSHGFLQHFYQAISLALLWFFLVFLLRAFVRYQWLAAVIPVLIFTVIAFAGSDYPEAAGPAGFFVSAVTLFALLRFGLVTLVTLLFVTSLLNSVPMTTSLSAWYAATEISAIVAVLALAGFAFYTSLGGQKLFSGNLLED